MEAENKKLTEEYRLTQTIRRAFNQGIREFALIESGDSILVGLSGGKDSLALLRLLGERRKKSNYSFRLAALHVKMDNVDYRSDLTYLENFAKDCGAEWLVRTGHFDADRDEKRSPCFLCSWNRRKILFETAQSEGFNKIALGHHQDDILHTALMNLTFEGSFATMPVKLKMRKFPITIIRPLCKLKESYLVEWAKQQNLQPLDKVCPFDKESNRTTIKGVFAQLEQLNAESRYSLWRALQKENKLVEE